MNILLITIFVLCLIYHTYTDLKEMLLYDWVNIILFFFGIVHAYLGGSCLDSLYGALAGAGIMLAIYFISCGGLGEGDVKLVPCLALWLGLEKIFLALLLSFVIGALIGGLLVLLKNERKNAAIPFGPFLCLGALISFFYGETLLMLYFNLFFNL